MKHTTFKRLISSYVDDELNETQKARVESHLAQCQSCQTFYRQVLRLKPMLNAEQSVEVNPFFAQRVLHRYYARKRENFWSLFERVPKPVLATGLVLSILVLSVFSIYDVDSTETPASNESYALFYENAVESNIQSDEEALAFVIYDEFMTMNGE